MTKFNPENKEVLTYGEALKPAMNITEPEDADQYLQAYISYIERMLQKEPRTDTKTAEEICKINLGYYAGYYGDDTRQRVEKLFRCSHPVFGSIEKNGAPTAQEAFDAGKQLAQKSLNQ